MIAVVIPYYQREGGILRRALASVMAQRDCPLPVHVVVVDDASPVPALNEVDGCAGQGLTLEVVHQANGGPGAARNAGAVWASDEFFIRVRHKMSYRKSTSRLFSVSGAQRQHLHKCVAELRTAFAGAALHRLRHGPRLSVALLRQQARTDLASLAAIPMTALRLLTGKT